MKILEFHMKAPSIFFILDRRFQAEKASQIVLSLYEYQRDISQRKLISLIFHVQPTSSAGQRSVSSELNQFEIVFVDRAFCLD